MYDASVLYDSLLAELVDNKLQEQIQIQMTGDIRVQKR